MFRPPMQQLQQRTAAAFGIGGAQQGAAYQPGGSQQNAAFHGAQPVTPGGPPQMGDAAGVAVGAQRPTGVGGHIYQKPEGAGHAGPGPMGQPGQVSAPIMGGPGQMGSAFHPLQVTHVPAEHAHVVHAILRALGGR